MSDVINILILVFVYSRVICLMNLMTAYSGFEVGLFM